MTGILPVIFFYVFPFITSIRLATDTDTEQYARNNCARSAVLNIGSTKCKCTKAQCTECAENNRALLSSEFIGNGTRAFTGKTPLPSCIFAQKHKPLR